MDKLTAQQTLWLERGSWLGRLLCALCGARNVDTMQVTERGDYPTARGIVSSTWTSGAPCIAGATPPWTTADHRN